MQNPSGTFFNVNSCLLNRREMTAASRNMQEVLHCNNFKFAFRNRLLLWMEQPKSSLFKTLFLGSCEWQADVFQSWLTSTRFRCYRNIFLTHENLYAKDMLVSKSQRLENFCVLLCVCSNILPSLFSFLSFVFVFSLRLLGLKFSK